MKTKLILGATVSSMVLGIFLFNNADCTSRVDSTSLKSTSAASANLYLSPSKSTVAPLGTVILTASGGASPYTYSLFSGNGSVTGNVYTAGSTTGQYATIKVTDSNALSAYTTVTIASTLSFSVSSNSVASGGTVTLSASGGMEPYVYSVLSGGGTITGSIFTAPSYNTTVTVKATDANGDYTTETISVLYYASLNLTPSAVTLYTGGSITFTASGGNGSYTYALVSGGGNLVSSTYVAPASATTATVQAWDTAGRTATANISVIKKVLTAASNFDVAHKALVVFNMPNSTSFVPSFAVGGADSSGNFGAGVNSSTSKVALGAIPASASIALTNFSWTDTAPYTGMLVVAGNSGTDTFNFCILQGDQSVHLTKVLTPLALTTEYKVITFENFVAQTSAGSNLQGLWVDGLDATTGVGSASLQVRNGSHNSTLSSCSNYSDYILLSASVH